MKKVDIEKFRIENPFSFLPYLINPPIKSDDDYEKKLNSLSLRHPDRTYLKSFLKKNLEIYDHETWRPYCHIKDFAKVIFKCL